MRGREEGGAVKALIFILVLQAFTVLWFGSQKQGYFIDEIYSFGLSNGYYKPFITSYGEEIFDQWADKTVIEDYMTVQKGERFAYGSVIYNQGQDVHPPVFYLVLHTVSSLFPERYSKWFGIVPNLLFLLLGNVVLWRIGSRLMKNAWLGLIPVVIWGFCAGAISYTIYIRMYMLLTFFTLLSMYLHGRLLEKGQTGRLLLFLSLTTIMGTLTQYYFVIFAFYSSGAYCLYKLFKRAFKEAAVYSGVMFGSVGAAILLFPACITQLTRTDEVVARETRKNIGNLDTLITNLKSYGYGINSDFLAGVYPAALVLILLAALAALTAALLCRKGVLTGGVLRDAWLFLAPWLASVLTIGAVAVVPSSRYICSLYPLMVLSGVWLLWQLTRAFRPALVVSVTMLLAVFLPLAGLSYSRGFVQYLYKDEPARLLKAREYAQAPCLYVTNYRMAALTQDLRTLSCYKEFYVTNKEKLKDIKGILEGRDLSQGLIVTVDNNEFWGSGYDAEEVIREICAQTGLSLQQCLFAEELSVTYVLK